MNATKRLELDIACGDAGKNDDLVLGTFDRLDEGDALTLRGDADLRPYFERLSAQRTGLFLWADLEGENGRKRAEILRRPPKETETTVGGYFGRDHDEIDALLRFARTDLETALRAGAGPSPRLISTFDQFSRRLKLHIRWEEEILFPAVEAKAPQLRLGPGHVMRMEHEDLRRACARLQELLQSSTPSPAVIGAAEDIFEGMTSLLIAHNNKEESVYYPLAERFLPEEESARLLSKVKLLR